MPETSDMRGRKRAASVDNDTSAGGSSVSFTKSSKSSHASSIEGGQTTHTSERIDNACASGNAEDMTRAFLEQWISKFEKEAVKTMRGEETSSYELSIGEAMCYLMQELFVFFNEVESEQSIEVLGLFSKQLAAYIRLYLSNWAQVIMVRRQKQNTTEGHLSYMVEQEDRSALYALEILAYLVHAYPTEVASLALHEDEVFQAIIYACLRARSGSKWLHASIVLWTWMGSCENEGGSMPGSSFQKVCADFITVATIALDLSLPWIASHAHDLQQNNIKMVGQQTLLLLKRALSNLVENKSKGSDNAALGAKPPIAVLTVQVLLILLLEDPNSLQNLCSDSQGETISQMESQTSAKCECMNEMGVKLLTHCPQHSPSHANSADCIHVFCLLAYFGAGQHGLHKLMMEEDPFICLSLASQLMPPHGSHSGQNSQCLHWMYNQTVHSGSCAAVCTYGMWEIGISADIASCLHHILSPAEHVLYRRLVCYSLLNALCPQEGENKQESKLIQDLRSLVLWLDDAYPFCNMCFQLLQDVSTSLLENAGSWTRSVERIKSVLEYLNSHEFTEEENSLARRVIGASVHALLRNINTQQNHYSELCKLLQFFEKREILSATQLKSALEQTNKTLALQDQHVSATSTEEINAEVTGELISIFSAAQRLLQGDYTDMDIRTAKERSLSSGNDHSVAELLNRIALKLQKIG